VLVWLLFGFAGDYLLYKSVKDYLSKNHIVEEQVIIFTIMPLFGIMTILFAIFFKEQFIDMFEDIGK